MDKQRDYSNTIRLQIPSNPKYLGLLRNFVFSASMENGFSLYTSLEIKLIIGEATSNIIKHAYNSVTSQPIFIELHFYSTKVEMVLMDYGNKLNLQKMKPFDPSDYREEGLGLFVLSQICDFYSWDDTQTRGNKLIIVKKK